MNQTLLDPKRPKNARQQLGKAGEEIAKRTLIERGFSIIEQNWRCHVGEIDLVAEEMAISYAQGGVLVPWRVFVEVRTRRGKRYGTALQSITPTKQAKLRQVAETYIQQEGWTGAWRIDVVAVQMDSVGRLLDIQHIRHAVGG
ncbi:MAG: YraN family protein [Chloroflexota bacterium]